MKSYDVVVIGGGVIGTSVAYYLSKKGVKVALVEKGDIASGSSSRCDGGIVIYDKKPGFDTKLGYTSQLLFKELVKEISYDIEYTQRGSLYIIESEQEFQIASEYVKKQSEDGYPFRMMDKKEIHEDEPYLAEDIVGGVEIGSGASVNPIALVFGLFLEAKKNGVDIFDYTYVKNIKLNKKGEVEAVETDQEMLLTNNIVNCAGIWAPDIGKMVGLDIPIKPRQGQILISEKSFPVGKRIIAGDWVLLLYLNRPYQIIF